MKTNIKTIYSYRETVAVIQNYFKALDNSKAIPPKLDGIINLLQTIETDLQLGGECILELDKPRLEAIEERDSLIKRLQELKDKVDGI